MQNSRVEMAFGASDRLSELVWSPHNGLSLKCAVSSSANNKPSLLWNVGLSINELSMPQSIRSKGSEDDKVVDDEKLIISQKPFLGDGKFARNNDQMEDEAGPTDAIRKEEACEDNGAEDLCSSHNVQIADFAQSSKKHAEQGILAEWTDESKLIRRACCNQNRRVEINASRSNATGLAAPIHSEPRAENFSEALVCSPPNLQSQQESDDEVTSASGKVNKNKTRIILYGRSSNDKENSQESAESCNSTKLFTKGGLKRQRNDQAQIVGSKRMKRQIQESHVSTSVVRPDSSFMNWISNMVKGLSDCNKVDQPTLAWSDNVCGNNHKDNFICNKTLDCESPNMDYSPEKGNPPLASLWITRLYSARLEKCKITEEARECSVFAKRLDALRHIMKTSEKGKSWTCTVIICFFCGTSGHDLRECPELTETELEDFLVKISSFERLEESPCLCITCFQFGHWAISCPLVSSRKRLSASNGFQKSSALNSEYYLEDERKFPPCNFANAQNAVAQEEMFRAIRKLRLSRADVLRWMNSNVSFSHFNGFFLRLRLRKVEAGLEGTGYYVARITEDTVENIYCNSKKSIFVDVGGIKSSVGSQYVSNHDFLEDEIKGWCSRIVKTGGKIPSLDELNSKLKDRTCLCF